MSDEVKQPGLRVAQVFLSSAHFEHGPNALSYPPTHKVTVHYGVRAEAHGANDGKAGIVTLTLGTMDDDPDALYRFHVELTGIIEAESDTPPMSVQDYVTKVGVTMLFPFLRETVANLTGRGRFGAIYIKPFNIHALQMQEVPAVDATAE